MRWTYAQVSLSGYLNGSHEELKQKFCEAMNIACTYLEAELKHKSINYNFTQFKTDDEES